MSREGHEALLAGAGCVLLTDERLRGGLAGKPGLSAMGHEERTRTEESIRKLEEQLRQSRGRILAAMVSPLCWLRA